MYEFTHSNKHIEIIISHWFDECFLIIIPEYERMRCKQTIKQVFSQFIIFVTLS